jgi:two-component system OmpR family response regulator
MVRAPAHSVPPCLTFGTKSLPEAKRRVLILDDNWFFAASLRLALNDDRSFSVCDAAMKPEGLEDRIAHFRPDLLIFDLSLGKASGLDVARSLRAHGSRIPIVFLSSQAGVPESDLAQIGNCAYLPKDKRPSTLIRLLKRVLVEASSEAPGNRLFQASSTR